MLVYGIMECLREIVVLNGMNGDISLLALPQSHIEHAQEMLLRTSPLIEVQALAKGDQKAVVEPKRRAKGRSKWATSFGYRMFILTLCIDRGGLLCTRRPG